MAVCQSCLPTVSKLRKSITGLRKDLQEKIKTLMDFSSVATMQTKVIAHLGAYGAGDRSLAGTTNNTTLPWTGSVTTGTPADARADFHWHLRPTALHQRGRICNSGDINAHQAEGALDLALENRFQILSLHDFPPMGAWSPSIDPAGPGAHQPGDRAPVPAWPLSKVPVSYGRGNNQGVQLRTDCGRYRREIRA
ncbi:hypothetical protein D4764_13G0012550 [Xyrichtys novacula]|uniref:Uncharacterized protein n=1 Tax=Xyrichtys novacula TaxID=13765 RepID=A0AAV1FZ53_XYRNO|nr:hypothetical protein D4764_13G0012550 [Xyrichtys novacula]